MFILGNSGIVITFIVNVTIFIQTKITMAQFLLLIFMVFFFFSALWQYGIYIFEYKYILQSYVVDVDYLRGFIRIRLDTKCHAINEIWPNLNVHAWPRHSIPQIYTKTTNNNVYYSFHSYLISIAWKCLEFRYFYAAAELLVYGETKCFIFAVLQRYKCATVSV